MRKCYRTDSGQTIGAIGAVLLIAGAAVLFVSIPGWAWCGLIGLALIAAGLLLVRMGGAGR